MRKSFLLKSPDDHKQNYTDNINPVERAQRIKQAKHTTYNRKTNNY